MGGGAPGGWGPCGGADWSGKGMCKGGCKGGKSGKPPAAPTPTGKMAMGVVKSFNTLNEYGFIECDETKAEYGNDVFVHGSNLGGLQLCVGQVVQFEVALNSRRKPQAVNIVVMEGMEGAEGLSAEPAAKKQRLAEFPGGGDAGQATWSEADDAIAWAQAM